MKKYYSLLLIFALLFTTILPALPFVSADTTENKVYANGEYELPFVVWQESIDEASVADTYFKKPAKLIVEDGKYTFRATLKNSSWWQYFKVESGDGFVDVNVVGENDDNTRVVEFAIDNLDQVLNAKVHIKITNIPGFNYDNEYDIRFKFDTSSIPEVKEETVEPDVPEQPEESENPEEPKQPEALELSEGDYTIELEALHAEEDRNSAMARYIDRKASLSVVNAKTYLTIVLNHETVTGFQVENKGELVNPKEQKIDEANNKREVTYELDELLQTVKAQVQYIAGTHQGNQSLRIVFNKDSLQEKLIEEPEVPEEPEQPEDPVVPEVPEEPDQPGETEEPELPEVPEEPEQPGETEEPGDKENPVDPEQPVAKYKDGEYDLPFVVLQADKDESSVANDYFEHPAKLVVKGEKYTIQTTLNNYSWWQYLKVSSTNGFVDVTEVDYNEAKDQAVVEFQVADIDKILHAKAHIIVTGIPGFSYDNEYDIRFQFDTSDLPLVDESDNGNDGNDNDDNNDNENNNNDDTNKEKNNNDKDNNVSDKVCKDQEIELPFEVLQASENEQSVADDYVVKPAKLIVKDGKFIVEMVLKNSSWWKYFKIATQNGFEDVTVISENKANDTRVVQFEIENPNAIVNGKVHISVTGIPGFSYDNKYDIRITFDTSGLPIDDCEIGMNGNGSKNEEQKLNNEKSNSDLENLSFDRNDDTNSGEGNQGKDSNEINPKTADKAKIALFSSLLICSLIPLLIKLRAKFRVMNE